MEGKHILSIISIIGITLLIIGSISYGISQIWTSTEHSLWSKLSFYTLITGCIIFGINIFVTIIYKNYHNTSLQSQSNLEKSTTST